MIISIWKLIVSTTFFIFAIIVGISTAFENVFEQEKEMQSSSSSLSSLFSTLDDNNDDMIISEEICPPHCSPPSP
ncbi:MAG TPA: hypothetical protein VFV86_08010 [Nitrososphaeraceae archaeon]|nr:hypothetical protein [Nitrososphaeraceae archaeon]